MDRAVAVLAARQHGVFAREQAKGSGASDRMIGVRLQTGAWERVHRSVYRLAASQVTWLSNVAAACLLFGPDALASHRTATVLHGLTALKPDLAIDLVVPRGHARPRPGITLHRAAASLHPADRTSVHGIPATAPARTLFDLAGIVPSDRVEEALDEFLTRRLVTVGRLRWQLHKESRRRAKGVGVMRALLAERGIGAAAHESVLETRLARILRDARVVVVPQFEVYDRRRFVARVDFAVPDLRVAIEADGYRWHAGRARWERDLARRNALTALGWQVIHVTTSDLRDASAVIAAVRAAVAIATRP